MNVKNIILCDRSGALEASIENLNYVQKEMLKVTNIRNEKDL